MLTLFLVCVAALVPATLLLLVLGHRLRFSSRILGLAYAAALTYGSAWALVRWFGMPPGSVVLGAGILLVLDLLVILFRPRWNPIGQAFYGAFLASALTYLAYGATYTVAAGLSVPGTIASGVLFLFELAALTLAGWYTFDSLDTICRTRADRPIPEPDPSYLPRVSLQIPAYNEPPDMLIDTIKSLEAIDYPDYEIVVIDNNTEDPKTWKPVEEYCRGRKGVRFLHVEGVEGFKAGALNLALAKHTDPDAELVGVVDADYRVDPSYLRSVVGYFADPDLAFLQTPQDYREYEGDPYLTACYDSYKYFFSTSMPSRNQRNSIIFAGTMGLIRRQLLEKLGGWDEWCITEDAEASLRLLKAGYSGLYFNRPYGWGIMPLSFSALKSQRFRWCFGGIQIIRRHWRDLIPWFRTRENKLSVGQRLDYLFGGLHWFNDVLYLGFTVTLLATAALLVTTGEVAIRPLVGALVLLPAALIGSGVLRALWGLRVQTKIGLGRALMAFAAWLSMSWTVALASIQGVFRKGAVFLRTPKTGDRLSVFDGLRAAKTETLVALLLWTAGAWAFTSGAATPFLLGLFAWQGAVYGAAPFMSLLNVGSKLPPELQRRRRTEAARERRGRLLAFGAAIGLIGGGALAAILLFGGTHPGNPKQPFSDVRRTNAGGGLFGKPIVPGTSPSPSVSASPSPSPSPSPSATASPSP